MDIDTPIELLINVDCAEILYTALSWFWHLKTETEAPIKGTTVAVETWFQNEPSVLAVFLLGMSCSAHGARRWSELRFPLSV